MAVLPEIATPDRKVCPCLDALKTAVVEGDTVPLGTFQPKGHVDSRYLVHFPRHVASTLVWYRLF